MPRQEVNIGVEGNDGTGDSIRQSFKKVNENFIELYAVFGIGGTINFTTLSDTPDVLLPNAIPSVNSDGSAINLLELASNSALGLGAPDTLNFIYDVAGKLVITSAFGSIGDDLEPTLGGPLNANGNGIANVGISNNAANAWNSKHPGYNLSIDDLVITKGYADNRYITSEIPLRPLDAPTGVAHYTWTITEYINGALEIDSYYNYDQEIQLGQGHGLTSASNGLAVRFNAEKNDPNGLTSNTVYYVRYVTSRTLWVYDNIDYAQTQNNQVAQDFKIDVFGDADGPDGTDVHTITDASYNSSLSGNFLSDVVLPRNAITLRTGDNMTGALYLHDHPGELSGQGAPNGPEDLQAATKFYVDNTAYSSPEVLFVSTAGDDSMQGVPPGKEGTSNTYAFKTINAAAQRAEELILAAGSTPGPYMQTIQYTQGDTTFPSAVMTAEIKTPIYNQARKLLLFNKEYIQKEVIGWIAYTFPDFVYNEEICERDLGLIIDAIAYDINRGLFTNSLTLQAAKKYYASVSGRRAITVQLTETVASIDFARKLVKTILTNDLYNERTIKTISQTDIGRIETNFNHGLADKNIVIIKNVTGMTEINDQLLYIKTTSDPKIFDLYTDVNLELPFSTLNFTAHVENTGSIGLRYQTTEDQYTDTGVVDIASITIDANTSNPVQVVTSEKHFLINNQNITISGIVGPAIDGSYIVRRVDDFTIELYSNNFEEVVITNVDIAANPIRVTTQTNHNLNNADQITVTGLVGATQLNNDNYYVNVISLTEIDLYNNVGLTDPVEAADYPDPIDPYVIGGIITQFAVDGRLFSPYVSGGIITKPSEAETEAINIITNTIAEGGSKFTQITEILENGLDASGTEVYGSTYKLVLTNGSGTGTSGGFVDQTNPQNADVLPGKVVRGKTSGALGRVVRFTNSVGTEAAIDPITGSLEVNPTVLEVNLLAGIDFEVGESLEYGNFIKNKEVVIRIEAGNYYEDFPIRLMNNVSLKGDEFRRVIIQPKTETGNNVPRVSQSKWASTYFYRDNEFDGLVLARGGTPFYNQENIEQGKFGYHYLYDPAKVIDVGPIYVNNGGYTEGAKILKANKDYIIEETNRYLTDKFPTLVYNETKSRRDTGLVIDSIINDLKLGGKERALESQGSFQELGYTDLLTQLEDSSQEIACEAALNNIRQLATYLLAGTAPSYTNSEATFTPIVTGTSYDFSTGLLTLAFGINHNLTTNDYIGIVTESLQFICEGGPGTYYYPTSADPAFEAKLPIVGVPSATSIVVNVGIPPVAGQFPHTFVGTSDNSITYNSYTAGSSSVINVEPPILLLDANDDVIQGEAQNGINPSAITTVGNLLDTILYVFDPLYNPPLRNDQMDMFLLSDTTIIRNVTCRGHGGFMAVLDPAGQILTKSPYIQTASSFSKSINRKVFSGGMFVDAYVGNLPTTILSLDPTSTVLTLISENPNVYKTGYLILNVQSPEGQGIRLRPPELPCPFYVGGRRFQVNAISDYDQANGTCKLYLDSSSNDNFGYDPTDFDDYVPGVIERDIFLQTAGNRSILGNDFTQVNDLGYGLVCTNGAFSEMVSMFTYYCHIAYYAKNGAEIRSLNGSNGYGNFGLVAEGADPNEIPDQVQLVHDMVRPAKVYVASAESFTANFDDPTIYVYDLKTPPSTDSVITIDHGGLIGTLNYRISTLRNMSDQNNNGVIGEVDDVVATGIKTLDQSSVTIGFGFVPADGTYPTSGTISPSTNGSGIGATVQVVVQSGVATVNLILCGAGYGVGETLTILGSEIGGVDGGNDLTVTISDVFPGTVGVYSNEVYKLDLRRDTTFSDDYFGVLQAQVPLDTIIEYRDVFTVQLTNVINVDALVTRPSTAVNFDESDDQTYRSINFQPTNSFGIDLPVNTTQATFELGYDHIGLEIVTTEIGGGYGQQGNVRIPIVPLDADGDYPDSLRITTDSRTNLNKLQPNDVGYVGGMRFLWDGKTHEAIAYHTLQTLTVSAASFVKDDTYTQAGSGATIVIAKSTSSAITVEIYQTNDSTITTTDLFSRTSGTGPASFTPSAVEDNQNWAFVEFNDVANTNINTSYLGTGLNSNLPSTDRILTAGAHENATAEITIAISLCRATGHDFTQIGTGGYNDSNYPNVILGDPVNPLATYYSNSSQETAAQVWERRKGRVFFVSTDQYGFFRVGKFFEVDQGTGSITFAGEIGLSNANALGFKKGVTIDEFSVDDGFVDDSASAVPTEKAVGAYIARVLGFNPKASQIVELVNKIGPGVLPRDGSLGMKAALDMQTNRIENVQTPLDGSDAANKSYVDQATSQYYTLTSLKDFGYNQSNGITLPPTSNQLLVSTGNYIIYVEPETIAFVVGETIGSSAFPNPNITGTIVKITTVNDTIFGSLRKIIYSPDDPNLLFTLDTMPIIYGSNGGEAQSIKDQTIIDNIGGSFPEFVQSSILAASDVSVAVSSTATNTETQIDIKDGVISNVHVNASAGIVQSKLSMNFAGTYPKSSLVDGQGALLNPLPGGWTQDNLGLVTFNNLEFNAFTPGFIELLTSTGTASGVQLNKIAWIGTDTVLGRSATGTGAVSQVTFTTVVSEGGGIQDSDFPAWSAGGENTQVLIRNGATSYTTVPLLASGVTNNTVVRRDSTGAVHASSLVIGGDSSYKVLGPGANATTIQLRTPGQRTMIEGSSDSTTAVTVKIPDKLNVGNAAITPSATPIVLATTEGTAQTNSGTLALGGRSGGGFVATNWVYTKAIEAIDEGANGGSNSTGITFGANSGFTESGDNVILMFTNGTAEARINTSGLQVDAISSLTSNTNLSLSGAGTGFVNVSDQLRVQNGSGSIALTINDGYGDANLTFNHANGTPDQNGNSGRIEVNVDSTTGAAMYFELKSTTSLNTAVALSQVLTLTETDSTFYTNLLPSATGQKDLGTTLLKWRNAHFSGTLYAATFDGVATSAKYADLAENYLADTVYDEGTVLVFGGSAEVTTANTKGDRRVAGLVSTNPAHLMNSELQGEHVVAIALQGRVPCKVIGKVTKGDMLVTSAIPGYAIVDNDPRIGTVLGKAVGEKTDDGKGVVEIVVGRV